MLFRFFILPEVPVSDPRHSHMSETLGHFILGSKTEKFHKIAEFDTWTHIRIRHGYSNPSRIGDNMLSLSFKVPRNTYISKSELNLLFY